MVWDATCSFPCFPLPQALASLHMGQVLRDLPRCHTTFSHSGQRVCALISPVLCLLAAILGTYYSPCTDINLTLDFSYEAFFIPSTMLASLTIGKVVRSAVLQLESKESKLWLYFIYIYQVPHALAHAFFQ